jgi:hypothetical protein
VTVWKQDGDQGKLTIVVLKERKGIGVGSEGCDDFFVVWGMKGPKTIRGLEGRLDIGYKN